ALNMRLREMRKSLAAQLLLYSEARLPFGTLAAARKIIGHYLDWKQRHFSFADYWLPGSPSQVYLSGMLYLSDLGNVPPATIFRCGFDPLRNVSVKYGAKLKRAAIEAAWRYFETLAHGFLRMSCR
ncbi:hypothetical protein BGZ57DRAFT_773194, partial [Hyaloscypha finlandica]